MLVEGVKTIQFAGNKHAHITYGNIPNGTPNISADVPYIAQIANDLLSMTTFTAWNIHSIDPKISQLAVMLNNPKESSIIGFVETWLNETVTNRKTAIPGYKVVGRRDRSYGAHGGVIVYSKSNIHCEDR